MIACVDAAPRDWWRRAEPAHVSVPPAGGAVPAPGESKSRLWAYRALLAFVFVNLVSPQSFIPALAPLRLAFMSALGAAGAYLMAVWSAPEGAKPQPTVTSAKIIWVLVGWSIVTIPASMWPGGSVALLLNQFSKTIILFWLVSSVLTSTKKLRSFYWTLAGCCIPLAYTAVKNMASGITGDGNRVAGYTSGIAANPNDLALTLNILIPLILSLAFTAKSRMERLAALGIVAIAAAAVFVTFSRGGFINLTVTMLLTAFVLMKRGQWGIVGAGAFVLILALPAVPSSYVDRLSTIVGFQNDTTGSAQERVELMSVAMQVVRENPLLGVGLGNDAAAINKIKKLNWRRVHNAYLNFAVDLGVPGALMFVAALFAAIAVAWRIEHSSPVDDPVERDLPTLAQGVRISLIGFAVAANFAPVPYDFYFYYLAGLSVAAWKCRQARVPAAISRG